MFCAWAMSFSTARMRLPSPGSSPAHASRYSRASSLSRRSSVTSHLVNTSDTTYLHFRTIRLARAISRRWLSLLPFARSEKFVEAQTEGDGYIAFISFRSRKKVATSSNSFSCMGSNPSGLKCMTSLRTSLTECNRLMNTWRSILGCVDISFQPYHRADELQEAHISVG